MTRERELNETQQAYLLWLADLRSPCGPKAVIDEYYTFTTLRVVLPGEGDVWDKLEKSLREDIQKYLGDGYFVTIADPQHDNNGWWSEFVIHIQ